MSGYANTTAALGWCSQIAQAPPKVALTHQDLSNMVEARWPAVTSASNRFQKGLIEKSGGFRPSDAIGGDMAHVRELTWPWSGPRNQKLQTTSQA
jgi:hypothetical protein